MFLRADSLSFQDKTAIGRANGVGPKLALRILVELRDKPITGGLASGPQVGPAAPLARPSAAGDAVAALMGLGVAEMTARRVVDQVLQRLGPDAGEGALIKAALQELGR